MHLCRKCIYGADKNDQILFSTYGKTGAMYSSPIFFARRCPGFLAFSVVSIPPEKEDEKEEWRQLLAPKQKEEEKSFGWKEQWPPLSRKRETQQQQKYLSTPNDRRHQRGKTRRAKKKLLTGLTKRKGISYSFLKLHAWHKTCIKACFCSSSIPRFFSYPFENATRDPSFTFFLFS